MKKLKIFLIVISVSLFVMPVFLSAQIQQQDSLALVALYNSTDGDNWTNKPNWLTGNVSTWYGITVSGDRVTQIDLRNNNLFGTIPTEIGNLTNLTNLVLEGNQLSDSIPSEIGNLTNLTNLQLEGNQLSGSIPSEIGNLTNLTSLLLYGGNQLSGSIPTEIGNLTNLIGLSLAGNQLSGSIPTEIGNLTNLTGLSLAGNQLSGSIPTEIGNLTNLTSLWLRWNQLSGSIPTEITNLSQLQYLVLYNNQFTDLPDLSSLVSLDYLQIHSNQFTFEDIEPNISVPSTQFTYSPQDNVGEAQDILKDQGSILTLSISVGGANNLYQWKKDGNNIGPQSSNNSYTISPVDFADAGVYTCEITNNVATELTLYSRPINLTVEVFNPLLVTNVGDIGLGSLRNAIEFANSTTGITDNIEFNIPGDGPHTIRPTSPLCLRYMIQWSSMATRNLARRRQLTMPQLRCLSSWTEPTRETV